MLEASNLDCLRGGRTLFRSLSFSLEGGELLRIAGANGSGKTSLLKILCGLLFPDSGEVRWQGTPIPRKLPACSRGTRWRLRCARRRSTASCSRRGGSTGSEAGRQRRARVLRNAAVSRGTS